MIHAVGPIWRGGSEGEAELLASAYRSSLALAREHDLQSVAFPAISTGIYGYPLAAALENDQAAAVHHSLLRRRGRFFVLRTR